MGREEGRTSFAATPALAAKPDEFLDTLAEDVQAHRLWRQLKEAGVITKDGRFRCKACGSRWIPGDRPKHDPGCFLFRKRSK